MSLADRRTLTPFLLVVQAGLALLAALGLLVFARLSNALGALAVPEAFALGGPLVLLLGAVGVAKDWRSARWVVFVWQLLTLLGTTFAAVVSGGTTLTLTTLLTGIALPLAIAHLVRTRQPISYDLQTALTAGLLFLTGLIHLALVPEHLSAPPRLGPLFALDGVAFVILALASLKYRSWRWPALALSVVTIVAYLVVVGRGLESIDDLGIATKLIELLAFGLIVWPSGARFSWRVIMPTASVLVAIGVAGSLTWAASLRPGPTGLAHDGRVVLAAAPPTDAQRIAAATLVDDTRVGIAPFTDLQVALADGYRPSTPAQAPTVHYMNPAYKNGHVLDTAHPQELVYANTRTGPLLLGAMYMLPKPNAPAPDIGGSLTQWHAHRNLCFLLPTFAFDGFASPFGTCPVGSINVATGAMLHVWTVANPRGPFADDLNPAFVARLTGRRATLL